MFGVFLISKFSLIHSSIWRLGISRQPLFCKYRLFANIAYCCTVLRTSKLFNYRQRRDFPSPIKDTPKKLESICLIWGSPSGCLLCCFSSISTAWAMGTIMAVVAVLLNHMDKNAVEIMNPNNNLDQIKKRITFHLKTFSIRCRSWDILHMVCLWNK